MIMKRFEYRVEIVGDWFEFERRLNRLGEKGWEAFCVKVNKWANGDQSIVACLKREKSSEP